MISEKVISIIADTGDIEPQKITLDSDFQELGLDSLDGIEIVCRLEEQFDIQIPNDIARQVSCVRDVVDAIEKYHSGVKAESPEEPQN